VIGNDDMCLPFSLLFISWIRAFPGNSPTVHNAFRILAWLLVFSRKYSMIGFHKMENMPAANKLVQCCQHIFTVDGEISPKMLERVRGME
jgi:hypothetical protein